MLRAWVQKFAIDACLKLINSSADWIVLSCQLNHWCLAVYSCRSNDGQPCDSMGVAVVLITEMGMGVLDRFVVVGMGVPEGQLSPGCVPLIRFMAMRMVRVLAV